MELPTTLLKQTISRGTIFHSSIFKQIDHDKFFIVIGESEEEVIGFFFINSKVNRHIFKTQSLLDLQYQLKKSDYPFLKYDSFLSCIEINKIKKSRLQDSLSERSTTIKGSLTEIDEANILTMVRSSKVFSPIEKRTFFQ